MKTYRYAAIILAMIMSVPLWAQVKVLTANDVTIEAGGTADLEVYMDYETTETVVSWGFSLYLPEGIEVLYDEEEEEYACKMSDEVNSKATIREGSHCQRKTDGGYLFAGYATGNPPLKTTHGKLITITLKAAADAVNGECKINAISISNDASISLDLGNIAEASCNIVVASPSAQPKNVIKINDLEIQAGGTADLEVYMDYETTETVVSWGFSLYLPEGIEVLYDEAEEEYACTLSDEVNSKATIREGAHCQKKSDGGYLFAGYATGNPPLKTTHGKLVTITLKAAADAVNGVCKINAISVSNASSISLDLGNIAEASCNIVVTSPSDQLKKVIKMNDIQIQAGGTADLEVYMDYETTETLVSWGFSLYLPEGVEVLYNEAEEEYACKLSEEINSKATIREGSHCMKKTDGGYQFAGFAAGNPPLRSTHGKLITITLKAATNAKSGECIINAISLSNDANISIDKGNMADAAAYINVDASSLPKTVLTSNDLSIKTGGTADLVVNLDYETTETVVAWGFSLYLPEGIEVLYNAEEEEYACVLSDEINPKATIRNGAHCQKKADGGYLFAGYADGNPPLKSTHGKLITITLRAAANAKSGTAEINNISLSNDASVSLDKGNIAEATFKVNVTLDPNMEFTATMDNVTYLLKYNNKTATVKGIKATGAIKVPGSVTFEGTSYAVTTIGESIFSSGEDFSYVSFPASITSVSEKAFTGDFPLYDYAVVWNADTKLPAALFANSNYNNRNFLLYVNNASYAPGNVSNVVVNGVAENIQLKDNYAFRCPQAFTANSISLTHNYQMQSGMDYCAGWESIALPFDVQTITHETKGQLTPFAAYNRSSGKKPFWLYENSNGKFVKASAINALKPYILSMPNNSSYPSDYNVNGKVTFAASNARVSPTIGLTPDNGWGVSFGVIGKSENYYALNVNNDYFSNTAGGNEGSKFVRNLRNINPFEIYYNGVSASREIAIVFAEEPSGIEALLLNDDCVRLYRIYDAKGSLVRSVTAKYSDAVSGLPAGLYFVNGQKVMLK